jgi:Flp pilus assembly protein TadD
MTEALAQEREAAQLDPVSPLMAATVGVVLQHMRRFDEAITELRNALTLDSSASLARKELGMTYIQKGLYDRGLAELRKLGGPDPYAACSLAYGYAVSGDKTKAHQMLEEMLKKPQPRARQGQNVRVAWKGGR